MVSPLIVDTFSGAEQPTSVWKTLAAAGAPWHGAIIKATQGTAFGPRWFDDHWPAVRAAGGDRYGDTWFRGAYHFLNFFEDGKAQADFYLKVVERAGGWDSGDLWPIVDVELGSKTNKNRLSSKQQVIDCTTAFADRVRGELGRDVMLYGNGAMRDLEITSRMGCSWLWCPRFTDVLPREIYERAGWSQDRLAFWQYAGDGVGGDNVGLKGFPASAPGLGTKCDISALTIPGGVSGLRSQLNGPSWRVLGAVVVAAIASTKLFGWW